jgi:hypothetical protein
MPTGACGINCDVCKLNLLGTCSSCGPGNSLQADRKLAAQQRLLGSTCPILDCARMNRIEYCMRDCNQFPCRNFSTGPYPFSQGFLMMQTRRLKERPPAFAPDGSRVSVAAEFWDELQQKDITSLCNLTLFEPVSSHAILFRFLNEDVLVDIENRCLKRCKEQQWQRTEDPLLELVTVLYLISVKDIYPVGRDIVGVKDLKEGHFFQGPHALKTEPLLRRYGKDLRGFREAAENLGGEAVEMADSAYRLRPFPRVGLYFLLWQGDQEFEPQITVLFDRSIEAIFAADAIWALANRVATALLQGAQSKAHRA